MKIALCGSKTEAKDKGSDEKQDTGACNRILLLDAFDTEDKAMLYRVVRTESDGSR